MSKQLKQFLLGHGDAVKNDHGQLKAKTKRKGQLKRNILLQLVHPF